MSSSSSHQQQQQQRPQYGSSARSSSSGGASSTPAVVITPEGDVILDDTIYINGLPSSVTEEELLEFFGAAGVIKVSLELARCDRRVSRTRSLARLVVSRSTRSAALPRCGSTPTRRPVCRRAMQPSATTMRRRPRMRSRSSTVRSLERLAAIHPRAASVCVCVCMWLIWIVVLVVLVVVARSQRSRSGSTPPTF